MKYRVKKKRMNQCTGSNSYSETRHTARRFLKKHRHQWSMAGDLKFYIRCANFPITKADTIWTAYLRLKRLHHRQIQYRIIRDVNMYGYAKSILRLIKKTNTTEVITNDHEA